MTHFTVHQPRAAHQNARGGNSSKIDAHVHSQSLIAALLLHIAFIKKMVFGAESLQSSAMQSLSKCRMKCAESSFSLARTRVRPFSF